MKKSLIKYLFFLPIFFYAQKNKEVFAVYDIIKNKNGVQLKSEGNLYINENGDKSLFFLSQYNNLLTNKDKLTKEENTLFLNKRKICLDDYLYFFDFDSKKAHFELYDFSCDTKQLVTEDIQTPKWKIEKYKKKVLGYIVNKATANINDRTWTVFYSTQIKSKANPWRFLGLSGLVILAKENTGTYTFTLNKFLNQKTKISAASLLNNIPQTDFSTFKKLAIFEYWKYIEKDFTTNNIPYNKNELPKYETLEFIEK